MWFLKGASVHQSVNIDEDFKFLIKEKFLWIPYNSTLNLYSQERMIYLLEVFRYQRVFEDGF